MDLLSHIQTLKSEGKSLPPIHQWHPERVYDFDLHIDREGRWFHEGTQIKRLKLVRLFASVLKKEGHDYFLVTPVEKARIQVEDVPFLMVEMEQELDKLLFRSNVDDVVCLSKEHPLELRHSELGDLPYVHVRDDLWARVNRNVYYQLVELAEEKQDALWLSSAGESFCVGKL